MHPLRSPSPPAQPLPWLGSFLAFGLPAALRRSSQVAIALDAVPLSWRLIDALRALVRLLRRWSRRPAPAVSRRRSFRPQLSRLSLRPPSFAFRVALAAVLIVIATGIGLGLRTVALDVARLQHSYPEEARHP